jgi:predicted nucleic acid-binding protein
VVDTNVVVSGILKNSGNEAAVLDLIADGALTLCISRRYTVNIAMF